MPDSKEAKITDASDDTTPQTEKPDVAAVDVDDEQADTSLQKLTKKELDALKLSSIEAVEVTPDKDGDVSQDPDKEVTIIPHGFQQQQVWWKRRSAVIAIGVLAVVVLLLAVPMTRYLLLGWVWHRDVTIMVQDGTTNASIAGATVTLGDRSATTDTSGKAVIGSVPLGYYTATVQKKYYGEAQQPVAVDILAIGQTTMTVRATGTITHLKVIDRLTGKVVPDVVLASAGVVFGRTNARGEIDAVIPKDKKEVVVTATSSLHNVLKVAITTKTRTIELVPTGSAYYLKKQDGRLDVVKSNYDGSGTKVVVPGTGDENEATTLFVASTDWQYALLRAKRAPNKPEVLYIVSTKDDAYKVVDDESAQFVAVGWQGHSFIYQSTKQGGDQWHEKTTSLKSYNAETGKTTILDQNASDPASSDGAALYETINAPALAGGLVTYAKLWTTQGEKTISTEGKQSKIISIKPDGSDQKVLKSIPMDDVTTVNVNRSIPDTVYYTLTSKSGDSYGEVTAGAYKDLTSGDAARQQYPAYIVSPGGDKLLWSEKKGDTYTIYVGDKAAGNKQVLAEGTVYRPYAWLSDDRIMVQKADTDLYVTMPDHLKQSEPLRISDYVHIDASTVNGYGMR